MSAMGVGTSSGGVEVDDRFTRPQGLYRHVDLDYRRLRQLILKGKLCPCYPGSEEKLTFKGIVMEECPVCMLYYPALNRNRCCGKSVCTECFLQIKAPVDARGPPECPFCKVPGYAVEYHGPKSREVREQEESEERLVEEAQRKVRVKEEAEEEERQRRRSLEVAARGDPNEIRPPTMSADKLLAKLKAEGTIGISSTASSYGVARPTPAGAGSGSGTAPGSPGMGRVLGASELSDYMPAESLERMGQGGRQSRLELEEELLAQAIAMSLGDASSLSGPENSEGGVDSGCEEPSARPEEDDSAEAAPEGMDAAAGVASGAVRDGGEEEGQVSDDGGVCLADVAYDATDPVGGYLPYEYTSPSQATSQSRYEPEPYTPPTESLISPEYLPRPPPTPHEVVASASTEGEEDTAAEGEAGAEVGAETPDCSQALYVAATPSA